MLLALTLFTQQTHALGQVAEIKKMLAVAERRLEISERQRMNEREEALEREALTAKKVRDREQQLLLEKVSCKASAALGGGAARALAR